MRGPRPRHARRAFGALALGLVAASGGCAYVALPFLYEKAELPESQAVLDLPYYDAGDAHPEKHRLDLFLPGDSATRPWPVLVFVHGGGWRWGDRAYSVAGADVYRNIGRFFASRGVGAAVISYRLQPEADWRDQVRDVARAVAWVRGNIADYGGDPDALFLSGHSAGAQLAAWVALDRYPLAALGVSPPEVCGLVAVSGAGFDLSDEETYRLGTRRSYYEKRFRGVDGGDAWMQEASVVRFAGNDAPPSLILYAEGEIRALQRQAQLLHAALVSAGAKSRLVVVPGEDHERIVLTLSRPDKTAAPAILDFIRDTDC